MAISLGIYPIFRQTQMEENAGKFIDTMEEHGGKSWKIRERWGKTKRKTMVENGLNILQMLEMVLRCDESASNK